MSEGIEQDLEITKSGNYNNLHLKPNHSKGLKGLDNGNFVIVEKLFVEGYENKRNEGTDKAYSFFNCKAKYKDEEVSFLLYDKEHAQFKECGGIGDKVKITLFKETVLNPKTNVEMLVPKLKFEKVE